MDEGYVVRLTHRGSTHVCYLVVLSHPQPPTFDARECSATRMTKEVAERWSHWINMNKAYIAVPLKAR